MLSGISISFYMIYGSIPTRLAATSSIDDSNEAVRMNDKRIFGRLKLAVFFAILDARSELRRSREDRQPKNE
jgi:hypothetical protein